MVVIFVAELEETGHKKLTVGNWQAMHISDQFIFFFSIQNVVTNKYSDFSYVS